MEKTVKILEALRSGKSPMTIGEIKEKAGISEPISLHLLWLLEMGFVEAERGGGEHPLLESRWRITPEGRTFLRFVRAHGEAFSEVVNTMRPFSLVLTYPRSEGFLQRPELGGLEKLGIHFHDVLPELLRSAEEEVLIASPYIGEVILPFLEEVGEGVRIRILTNEAPPFLKRLTKRKNVEVSLLKRKEGDVQLYQLHSKFLCVDGKYCLVGSMNLNERSLYYNFETGVFIEDENLGRHLRRLFGIMIELSSPLTL